MLYRFFVKISYSVKENALLLMINQVAPLRKACLFHSVNSGPSETVAVTSSTSFKEKINVSLLD